MQVFKTLDLKNDGVIDIDELTEYLTDMLGHKPKQVSLTTVFKLTVSNAVAEMALVG